MEDIKKLNEILRIHLSTQIINRGIGPLSLLGIALVVLKAMGYINISWIWALAPFWIPLVFTVIFVWILFCIFGNLVSCKVFIEESNETESAGSTYLDEAQNTPEPPVAEEQIKIKSRKKRPKKKKEELNNGESKDGISIETETSIDK